jgi:hypothetical protein
MIFALVRGRGSYAHCCSGVCFLDSEGDLVRVKMSFLEMFFFMFCRKKTQCFFSPHFESLLAVCGGKSELVSCDTRGGVSLL